MNYRHHLEACAIIAVFVIIIGFTQGVLTSKNIIELLGGAIPYATIITCDLDSSTSLVSKMWGPFKIIWKPFSEWGHREILHHFIYGPFILVGIWLLPALWVGMSVPEWTIIGAVLMLWTHISTDIVYSGTKKITKKIMPKWLERKINKIF